MFAEFMRRAGLPSITAMVQVVEAVRSMPYGRPAVRTIGGVFDEWRGTCTRWTRCERVATTMAVALAG